MTAGSMQLKIAGRMAVVLFALSRGAALLEAIQSRARTTNEPVGFSLGWSVHEDDGPPMRPSRAPTRVFTRTSTSDLCRQRVGAGPGLVPVNRI
jgi:hypothetical protein